MMNFASYCWDALEERKDCKFATFIASQGTCILLGSVNTTMEISSSAAATSRVKECTCKLQQNHPRSKVQLIYEVLH